MRVISFILFYFSIIDLSAQVLNKSLDSLLLKENFNGGVLIIHNDVVKGKTQQGFADEIGNNLTSKSSFNLASVSKHFTALAISKLIDDRRVQYESPISEYLPELKHSKYKDVKVYHLIHHTSGLPAFHVLLKSHPKYATPFATNKSLLALFKNLKPDLYFAPGNKYEYSNTGYIFLASIVEAVSGMNFSSYLEKQFFKPLELTTAFGYAKGYKNSHPDRVKGLNFLNGQVKLNDLTHLDGVIGDGNIYLSLDDLVKWDKYLNSKELLSAEWHKKYFSIGKGLPKGATPYGFGWVVSEDRQVVQHAGEWVGFNTFYYKDLKSNFTVVVLSNNSMEGANFNKIVSKTIYMIEMGL